jgi:hypothetical protein
MLTVAQAGSTEQVLFIQQTYLHLSGAIAAFVPGLCSVL